MKHSLLPRLLAFLPISFAAALFLPANAGAATGPIARALQPFVDRGVLAGVVTLVTDKDRVLDRETVGYADIEAKKPMDMDNLFSIASMTKPMTTTALMMLVDEGKVGLDDPVEKYLPEFKNQMYVAESDQNHMLLKKPTHPVLVRNLVSHTSGMNNRSPEDGPTWDGSPLKMRVSSYASLPLDFDPGTQWHYSNAGINTAGRIVEVVSKMPYDQFLQQRLFTPLGMKDTTFWPTPEQSGRLAKFYADVKGKTGLQEESLAAFQFPLDDRAHRYAMPAGGAFSTADDLARFCQMMLGKGVFQGHRYLSEAAVAQMSSNQIGDLKAISGWHEGVSAKDRAPDNPERYGYGMFVCPKDTGPVDGGSFGHDGAFKTLMWMDPAKHIALIFLVQLRTDDPAYSEALLAFYRAAVDNYGSR